MSTDPTAVGAVAFYPSRWRMTGALVLSSVIVVVILVHAAAASAWIWLIVLPAPIILAWYTSASARGVRVTPGTSIEYRDVSFRKRTIPVDPTLEILYFANVVGTESAVRQTGSPIGVIDQRWAVIRSLDHTRVRLGMRLWSGDALVRIAQLAPAKLRVVNDRIAPQEVSAAYPDYYTALERRPRLYLIVFAGAILYAAASIAVAIRLAHP